jgi:type II secretory pathway pseudopilin PulG
VEIILLALVIVIIGIAAAVLGLVAAGYVRERE